MFFSQILCNMTLASNWWALTYASAWSGTICSVVKKNKALKCINCLLKRLVHWRVERQVCTRLCYVLDASETITERLWSCTCSGVQKMCASSWQKRRTLVSPPSAPECSLRCSAPKSAQRMGSSLHERTRCSNITLNRAHERSIHSYCMKK